MVPLFWGEKPKVTYLHMKYILSRFRLKVVGVKYKKYDEIQIMSIKINKTLLSS